VFVAPVGKDSTFVLGSGFISRDPVDGVDTKGLELSNGSCGCVFVRNPAADELAIHGARRVGENCNSHGNTAVKQLGGFEHTVPVRILGNDNDVGQFDAPIDDECSSSCPQNGSSNC